MGGADNYVRMISLHRDRMYPPAGSLREFDNRLLGQAPLLKIQFDCFKSRVFPRPLLQLRVGRRERISIFI